MDERNRCYQSWLDSKGRQVRSEIYYCDHGYRTVVNTAELLDDRCYDWKDSCSYNKPRTRDENGKTRVI